MERVGDVARHRELFGGPGTPRTRTDPDLPVVVNDGFDEADARVSVRIEGRLAALATVPLDDPAGDARPSMQVLFNTDVAPDTVERAGVTWRPEAPSRGANAVTGSVHYDVDARRMTLTPTADADR